MNADQLNAILMAANHGAGLSVPSQPLHSSNPLLSLLTQQHKPAPVASPAASVDPQTKLLALLLQQQQEQKQREEQEKLLLLQKLQALSNPAPTNQDLALQLLLQQKPAPDASVAASANALNLLKGASILGAQDPSGSMASILAGQQGAALAKLMQQDGPQNAAVASGLPSGLTQDIDAVELAALSGDRKRKGRTGTFPQKLHQMLSDLERQEGGTEIACFLPHGRAFLIRKPREFVKHVMPKYFRMSRFSSFQRQLNLYDFQRITEGPDKGSYYHELFVKGRPILSTMMKRNKIKGVKNKNVEQDGDDDEQAHE